MNVNRLVARCDLNGEFMCTENSRGASFESFATRDRGEGLELSPGPEPSAPPDDSYSSNFKSSPSSMAFTPSDRALSSFDPGSAPATT
jgi:hypothetical protein